MDVCASLKSFHNVLENLNLGVLAHCLGTGGKGHLHILKIEAQFLHDGLLRQGEKVQNNNIEKRSN